MKKELISQEQIEKLNEAYPVSEEGNRLTLPRFGMLSKDIIEESGTGKTKKIKIIQAAGTFFTESDKGEVNEEGKKIWTKEFIDGETVDVIITFHRKQLRKFDSSLEKFISSPIYDSADQVIPLYLDKQIIHKGTQKELQTMYPALTQKGKPTSDLKENTILYILYKNELYQCDLSQSSKWEFMSYKRTVNPSTVFTTLGSVEETFGKNTYRKMTFKNKGLITQTEFDLVTENQGMLKEQIASDAKFLLESANKQVSEEDVVNKGL